MTAIGLLLVFLMNAMWALAFLQLLSPFPVYLLVAGSSLFLFVTLSGLSIDQARKYLRRLTPFEKLLLCFIVFLLVTSFLRAFAPVTGIDTLAQRLNTAKRYIQHGGFVSLPHSIHSNLNVGAEMLYALALLIGPAQLAALFAFGFAFLLLAASYSLAHKVSGRSAGIYTAVFVVSNVPFYYFSHNPLQDSLATLFLVLALHASFSLQSERGGSAAIIMGVFCGAALAVKLTAGVFIFALFAAHFTTSVISSPSRMKVLKYLVVASVITLLAYVPWMLKSHQITGNPLYPLLNSWFDIRHPHEITAFEEGLRQGPGIRWSEYFYYPFYVSFINSKRNFLGPLMLVFFPVALYLRFWRKKWLTFFAITGFITYTVAHYMMTGRAAYMTPRPRHIYIVIVLLSIICGWAASRVRGRSIKLAFRGLLLSWLIFFTTYTTYRKVHAVPVLLGLQSAAEYHKSEKSGFDYYEDYLVLNRLAHPGEKVLTFDSRAFYLEPDYFLAVILDRVLAYEGINTADSVLQWLHKNGVRYVYLCNREEYHSLAITGQIEELAKQEKITAVLRNADLDATIYVLPDALSPDL